MPHSRLTSVVTVLGLAGMSLLPASMAASLRAGAPRKLARRLSSIKLTSYVSPLGVVPDAYVLTLCEGFGNGAVDDLLTFVAAMDALESQPGWKATVSCEVRQEDADLFLLCLEGATAQALEDLLQLEAVCSITEDGVVKTSRYTWGTDRINQANLPMDGMYSPKWTGAGVDVYVLDTGLDPQHAEFLGPRLVRNLWDGFKSAPGCTPVCGSGGSTFNNDANGHGSHVAGTVGGQTVGVAPGAGIFGIKVLGNNGLGSFGLMIQAIDWVAKNVKKTGIPSVIAMSISGGFYAPINSMIDSTVGQGITVTVAAGNSEDDACSYSPASAAGAITVGSTTSVDAVSYFSNHGKCVQIYAPGSKIVSVATGTGTGFASFSGTSMATPHVAGAVALLLQARPGITTAQVRATLLCLAVPQKLGSVENGNWVDSAPRFLLQAPPDTGLIVMNDFTEETCHPLPLSRASCGELGWTNAVKFGDFRVCGESDQSLGGCSGKVSWTAAKSFCEVAGARLCSLQELQNDETRATGCSADSEFVWSSSGCDGGHALGLGSSQLGKLTACAPDGNFNPVRCCATVEGQPKPAAATCEELGWTNGAAFGDPLVCGESDLGLGTPAGTCSGLVTWQGASDHCTSVGARLCSADELANDESRGTGCGYDGTLLWSSTKCPGGFTTAGGSSQFKLAPQCSAGNLKKPARCCADSSPPQTADSKKTCAALNWPNAATFGNPRVCGESDLGLGGCNRLVAWADADEICRSAGARLCTLEEVEADETRATGCNFDNALIWTASSCSGESGIGRAAAPGSSAFSSAVSATCLDNTKKSNVRCCADVAS